MTSLDDALATLRVVVPGFMAIRWFYFRAFPSRRSDLELVLWSLVASAPLWWAASLVLQPAAGDPALGTVLLAAMVGIIASELLVRLWRWLISWRPALQTRFARSVWDSVMMPTKRGSWYEVHLNDGTSISGWLWTAAHSAEADDPDIYLCDAAYTNDGAVRTITDIDGVLIPRASIVRVHRYDPIDE